MSSYSQFFASRGANVVVNDVSRENAQKVVDAIVQGAWCCDSGSMASRT